MKTPLFPALLLSAVLVVAAAAPAPEAAVTRTPRPTATAAKATAQAAKTTAQAAATQAAATAQAAKATAQAVVTQAAATAQAAKATAQAVATQAAATATAMRLTRTPPAKVKPEEAAAAIQAYADSVLGISVKITQAGGLTGQVNRTLTQTTTGSSAQSAQTAVAKLAVQTYGALLSNGAASLSYGTGTLSGDVTVDVQGSSLGIYSLLVTTTTTLDANAALKLATDTFPKLAGRAYTVYAVSKGYAWYFKGATTGLDVKTRQAVTVAEAIVLYVLPGAGKQTSVSATVGRGDFAANVKVP